MIGVSLSSRNVMNVITITFSSGNNCTFSAKCENPNIFLANYFDPGPACTRSIEPRSGAQTRTRALLFRRRGQGRPLYVAPVHSAVWMSNWLLSQKVYCGQSMHMCTQFLHINCSTAECFPVEIDVMFE